MNDPIRDLNRELVNRYPNALASSYDEFVEKVLRAIQTALNETDAGAELIDPLVAEYIRNSWSEEEWQLKKANVMKMLFFTVIDAFPLLKKEMSYHLYRELRKES